MECVDEDRNEPQPEPKGLNERLLSLEKLRCGACRRIPLGNVFSYDGGRGVLCEACLADAEANDGVLNEPLTEVVKLLTHPCTYRSNGCQEESRWDEAEAHKASCPFRSSSCPMGGADECPWSGRCSLLVEHFEAGHGDSLLKPDDQGAFTVSVNLKESADKTWLLQADGEYFLLSLVFNVERNKLFHKMYHISEAEASSCYRYSMEPFIKSYYYLKLEEKCLPFSSFETGTADVGSPLDFAVLGQIFSDLGDSVNLKVCLKHSQVEELDEKLLSFFECPVCNNYMKPPIFQCLSGHSLCCRCRPKLGHCPTCRASFGSTRNYALESMTNGVRYPCVYRELGCRKISLVSEILQHETECTLRPYNCPFGDTNRCRWEGPHSTINTHLKSVHPDKIHHTDYYQTTIPFSFDQQYNDMLCMLVMGEVFRVSHRRDVGNQNGYWSVQLVGPRGEAKNYKYEVGLVDLRNDCRRLIRIDPCQDLTNKENLFNQCILIPITIISWFACNSQLSYYVKITKK